jgi:hypothetical protein
MIWSKLKKTVEPLAALGKEHLRVQFTRYGPGESLMMNRPGSPGMGRRSVRSPVQDEARPV